jgi:putative tryptophan/tyrosine transport system substrate-binding protein
MSSGSYRKRRETKYQLSILGDPPLTKSDGLLSYGPDLRDIVRRGAPYVDQVLRGAKPADLPVQVPVKFEMAINAKTAKTPGLTVSSSMVLRADEVIE